MSEIRTSLVIPDRAINIKGRVDLQMDNTVKDLDDGGVELPQGKSVDDFLVMASPANEIGSSDWSRVPTGGRALDMTSENEPFKYKMKIGKDDEVTVQCMDFLVKGVGAQYFPGKLVFAFLGDDSGELTVYKHTPQKSAAGRELPVRYAMEKTQNPTGYMGFQWKKGARKDIKNTSRLIASGFRTRKPVFLADLKRNILVSTSDGMMKLGELLNQIPEEDEPVISGWAIRSKYRLDDITWLRTRAEKNSNPDVFSLQNQLAFSSRATLEPYSPKSPITHDPFCLNITDEERDILTEEAIFFANELLKRMRLDENYNFSMIAQDPNYSQGIDGQNLNAFMRAYIDSFIVVYSEQLALLQSMNGYIDPPTAKMFNSQNVTALAEIVDHDITSFLDNFNAPYAIKQLERAWEHLSKYIRDLHLIGAIDYVEGEDLRENFIPHFFEHLGILDSDMAGEFVEYIQEIPFESQIYEYRDPIRETLENQITQLEGEHLDTSELRDRVENAVLEDAVYLTNEHGQKLHRVDLYGAPRKFYLKSALDSYLAKAA